MVYSTKGVSQLYSMNSNRNPNLVRVSLYKETFGIGKTRKKFFENQQAAFSSRHIVTDLPYCIQFYQADSRPYFWILFPYQRGIL